MDAEMEARLKDIVFDQKSVVSFHQLCTKYSLTPAKAQNALQAFAKDYEADLAANYVWIGQEISRKPTNTKNRMIKLLSKEEIKECQEKFTTISIQIYSVIAKKDHDNTHMGNLLFRTNMNNAQEYLTADSEAGESYRNGKLSQIQAKGIECKATESAKGETPLSSNAFDRKPQKSPFASASRSSIFKSRAPVKQKLKSITKEKPAQIKVQPENPKPIARTSSKSRNRIIESDDESDENDPFGETNEETPYNPPLPTTSTAEVEEDLSRSKLDDPPTEPAPQSEAPAPVAASSNPSPPPPAGKRRIKKNIRRITKEGYMVTESVWVEEDIQDTPVPRENSKPLPEAERQQKRPAEAPKAAKKKPKTVRKPRATSGGGVQQSLTSFFSKK